MDANEYIRKHLDSSDAEIAQALGITQEAARSRRRRLGLTKTQANDVSEDAKWRQVADKVIDALKVHEITPETVGAIKKIRVSQYQSMIKTPDGEPEVVDLGAVRFEIDPSFKDGPQWPVVQQAAQIPVKLPKPKPSKSKIKTAIILPDPQIGFRRDLMTDKLDPFHDERAMAVALQMIVDLQPDLIVNLGDFLDLPDHSKYMKEPGFALTTQQGINRGYRFLVEQRTAAPNAKIVLLEGNHDLRLKTDIIVNAKASFGLCRAEHPDNWPVLSVPFLLRVDELGVQYVSGYSKGCKYLINNNLQCKHGKTVRSNGSTAYAIAKEERVSTIFGHIHRIEMQYKTVETVDGFKTSLAFTPGTLARIDGAVPSTNSGMDEMGKPTESYENWQQGVGVVYYEDGDGDFHVHGVHIHNGRAMYGGKLYVA